MNTIKNSTIQSQQDDNQLNSNKEGTFSGFIVKSLKDNVACCVLVGGAIASVTTVSILARYPEPLFRASMSIGAGGLAVAFAGAVTTATATALYLSCLGVRKLANNIAGL